MQTPRAVPASIAVTASLLALVGCLATEGEFDGLPPFTVEAPPPTTTGCIETGHTYSTVEISFRLDGVEGNPFAVEAWGLIERPRTDDDRLPAPALRLSGRPREAQGTNRDLVSAVPGPESRKPGAGRPYVHVPAFYDGDGVWRLRYTPDRTGPHAVRIAFGARRGDRERQIASTGPADAPREMLLRLPTVSDLSPERFTVTGAPTSGFVRRSRARPTRFELDDGTPYFPLGYNVAWSHGGDAAHFRKHHAFMRRAGLNWSRHWMAGFANLQLDWHADARGARRGELDLEIARAWDAIVESAERAEVRFQMVLQHHGQFSTTVAPNWQHNPLNVANGGWLQSAADFFADRRAGALARIKYRYIVARWGYSPAVMAFELFNEAQFTDAGKAGDWRAIRRWHAAAARYIRSIDPYDHLVTTSSLPPGDPIWRNLDYYQTHAYDRDMIHAASRFVDATWRDAYPRLLDRPIFHGEMGDHEIAADDKADGRYNRAMLWAGLFSGGGGAAQLWAWEAMDRLERDFLAVRAVLDATRLDEEAFAPVEARCACEASGDVAIRPGYRFEVGPAFVLVPGDGAQVRDVSRIPAYVHGDRDKQRQGLAAEVFFNVEARDDAAVVMRIDTVSKKGAALKLAIDGGRPATTRWDESYQIERPARTVTAAVPPGTHLVMVASRGDDWFKVNSYTFRNCTTALGALAVASPGGDEAVAWVYNRRGVQAPSGERTPPVSGRVTIASLAPGTYDVEWRSTADGSVTSRDYAVASASGELAVDAPAVSRDVVLVARRR